MKNLLLSCVLLCLPFLAFNQDKSVKTFYNKYKDLENATDIKLQGWLIKLASNYADDEVAEKLMKKVSFLRILVMEEGNPVSKEEYNQLLNDVRSSRFEDLMMVRDGKQNVQFLIREKGDTITDVLIIVHGEAEFVLLSLEGALKFSDLNDLHIDIDGGEHFQKLPEEKKDLPRA